ncbi:MAG: heme o synthase [Candidatus Binatia bacterium]
MTPETTAVAEEAPSSRGALAYLELTKPRVVVMVVATTVVGFYMGLSGPFDLARLLHTLLSTALAAAGTLALNEYLERDLDQMMLRTRQRPIPSGRVQPFSALLFGSIVAGMGIVYQTLAVDAPTALVTVATTVSYLFVYTPMKRVSSFCSLVGAVPGALPPVTGWVAARGTVDLEAWVLFAILFLWQLPHSLAIARLYRDDYARAGIQVLPVVDPEGSSTGRQIVLNSAALLTVAGMPTLLGLTGGAYFASALVLGLGLLAASVQLARRRTLADARRLLFATLIYLPLLLGVMTIDKTTRAGFEPRAELLP